MLTLIRRFKESNRQTKYFILTWAIYIIALIWSTLHAYARLEYSRSDAAKTIVIQDK